MMLLCGNSSPISMAHKPVPVAMSRILRGGLWRDSGARYLRPSNRIPMISCWLFWRPSSGSSFGKWYATRAHPSATRKAGTKNKAYGQPPW